MWLNSTSLIQQQDLVFEKPLLNTPGTLGFAPDPHSMPFLKHLGAFITNPISFRPRQPAGNRVYLPFAGGFLLHTGLPNPGLKRTLKRTISRFKRRWASAPLPIIVHLLAETPGTLAEIVQKLEGLENIMALEIGLSPMCDPPLLETLLDAASGELPVIVCLSPEQIPILQEKLKELQPTAVHLSPPRGTLPTKTGEKVSGRLYGSATFPLMLHAIQFLLEAELKVIAYGGINALWQVQTLLETGAMGVSLGEVLWKVDPGNVFIPTEK